MNVVRRGQLARLDDSKKTQNIQIILLDEEVVEGVERFQQYGFSSHPTSGDVLCVAVGAKSNQLVSLCVNDSETRVNIEGDDVAVYHKEGHKIVLSAGGVITHTCKELIINAETSVKINTPDMTITADQSTIDGPLKVTGDVIHEASTTIKENLTVEKLTTTNALTMGGGGEAKITGSIHVTKDVRADNKIIAANDVEGKDFVSKTKQRYNEHKHPVDGDATGVPKDA